MTYLQLVKETGKDGDNLSSLISFFCFYFSFLVLSYFCPYVAAVAGFPISFTLVWSVMSVKFRFNHLDKNQQIFFFKCLSNFCNNNERQKIDITEMFK